MIKLGLIAILLLISVAGGCTDACETLVEETCARHGDDSAICLTRTHELDSHSNGHTKVCERALMLMRSLPESE
jgi:hypothetical protein